RICRRHLRIPQNPRYQHIKTRLDTGKDRSERFCKKTCPGYISEHEPGRKKFSE
uniref:Uncharacterized protein n=1 Tax=Anser cygnoides TaxID=8845 RepID=A0A8B9IR01_ANSCY